MNKNAVPISIIFLVVVGLIVYYTNEWLQKSTPIPDTDLLSLNENLFVNQKRLNETAEINNFFIFRKDGDSQSINEYIKEYGYPLLFFRFSRYHCKSCIYEVMEKLDQLANKNVNDKIVVLGDFFNPKDIIRFNHFYVKKDNIFLFRVPDQDIQIPAESVGLPYVFQLDNYKISNFLLININNLTPFDRYIESLID